MINQYKKIDQRTLTRVGLKQKEILNQSALSDVYNFSQLQRFRQNKDLNAVSKMRSIIPVDPDDSDLADSDSERWWLQGDMYALRSDDKKQNDKM